MERKAKSSELKVKHGLTFTFKLSPLSLTTGFTLIEVLIALAVFSIMLTGMIGLVGYVTKRYEVISKKTAEVTALTNFLESFTNQVKHSREILYVSSREITIWETDSDNDGRPYTDETVTYYWDGKENGALYLRRGYNETPLLLNVSNFDLIPDHPAPKTRHLLVRLEQSAHVYPFSIYRAPSSEPRGTSTKQGEIK